VRASYQLCEAGRQEPETTGMRHFAKIVALQLLRGYKWAISPLFPPSCRYVPTCSEYAMEAVERYGAVRGSLKTLARLLRCHPLARGGYDPVVKGSTAMASGSREKVARKKTEHSRARSTVNFDVLPARFDLRNQ